MLADCERPPLRLSPPSPYDSLDILKMLRFSHLALLCLAFPLLHQRGVRADDSTNYPEWVTNDYNCVIGCLQIFNSSVTERPDTALEKQGYSCVLTTCSNDTTAMNLYQAQYIISMFYATGSIYESANMTSATDSASVVAGAQTSALEAADATAAIAAGAADASQSHIGAVTSGGSGATSANATGAGSSGTNSTSAAGRRMKQVLEQGTSAGVSATLVWSLLVGTVAIGAGV
ncbi:hypothetical protein JCM24511_04039 [Saitozyma sp. JCM 24511]|nr:hypothetical protein JCM24511_04039 [Saitozyma sp. JCM 24511]